MMKLLITGSFNWKKEYLIQLEEMGWELVFTEREDSNFDFDPKDIDAAVCNWLFVNHDISNFTSLKAIQLLSAGLDRVPLQYIVDKHIQLFNARGVYSVPLAEQAVAGVLQLYRSSRFFMENQKKHTWIKKKDLNEIYGKRVCVLGCGSVGVEVAKRFRAFTDKVYGLDIAVRIDTAFNEIKEIRLLDDELQLSDIVILTLPLTDQTKHMFSTDTFNKMKPDSVFVNIARGALVDTDALCAALDSKLYGAVIDVFEEEPLPSDHPIWDKENIIITPHISYASNNNDERMWNIISDNLRQFYRQNNG
ncbi:MAG: hydroxyacid dehydrogenase [Ruminococcus sp.]|nr:hydroxyacid dehydrogenase [Ruminococcus sp.]